MMKFNEKNQLNDEFKPVSRQRRGVQARIFSNFFYIILDGCNVVLPLSSMHPPHTLILLYVHNFQPLPFKI